MKIDRRSWRWSRTHLARMAGMRRGGVGVALFFPSSPPPSLPALSSFPCSLSVFFFSSLPSRRLYISHSLQFSSYIAKMGSTSTVADTRFKLNTGAEIPALGLGMAYLQITRRTFWLISVQEPGSQALERSKRPWHMPSPLDTDTLIPLLLTETKEKSARVSRQPSSLELSSERTSLSQLSSGAHGTTEWNRLWTRA